MRPITVTVGPLAAGSANYYSVSATPTSGTPLTLAHTATPDLPRRVLLTYGSEGGARTLVLVGTNWQGTTITETLAVPSGGAGTVQSVLDYKTLISATPLGGGWTAPATLGTSGVASSPWVRTDDYGFAPVGLAAEVTGTVNYTVQASDDDPNQIAPLPVTLPAAMTWISHSVLVAQTASAMDSYSVRPTWVRVLLNSGAGSVALVVSQAGGKLG